MLAPAPVKIVTNEPAAVAWMLKVSLSFSPVSSTFGVTIAESTSIVVPMLGSAFPWSPRTVTLWRARTSVGAGIVTLSPTKSDTAPPTWAARPRLNVVVVTPDGVDRSRPGVGRRVGQVDVEARVTVGNRRQRELRDVPRDDRERVRARAQVRLVPLRAGRRVEDKIGAGRELAAGRPAPRRAHRRKNFGHGHGRSRAGGRRKDVLGELVALQVIRGRRDIRRRRASRSRRSPRRRTGRCCSPSRRREAWGSVTCGIWPAATANFAEIGLENDSAPFG